MIDAIEFTTPYAMAKHLAKYVNDPSAIVAGTANHFGRDRAISRDQAERMVLKRKKERERESTWVDRTAKDTPDFNDGWDFDPRIGAKPSPKRPKLTVAAPSETAVSREVPKPNNTPWPKWFKPFGERLPADMLLRSIANDFGISVAELKGKNRSRVYVHARSVAARILKERGLSYPIVARLIGKDDHTTAMWAVSQFDVYARQSPRVTIVYERYRDNG